MGRSTGKPMLWMMLLMLGLTLALPAAAQWKWRDKSGQIQYSDRPPPAGTPAQEILQKPGTAVRREAAAAAAVASSGASAPSLPSAKASDPELEARRRKAEQETEAAKKKPEDEKITAARADNCARARSYMRTLDEGVRVARTNAKGEREVLDDKGRAEEAARTRGVIAADCK